MEAMTEKKLGENIMKNLSAKSLGIVTHDLLIGQKFGDLPTEVQKALIYYQSILKDYDEEDLTEMTIDLDAVGLSVPGYGLKNEAGQFAKPDEKLYMSWIDIEDWIEAVETEGGFDVYRDVYNQILTGLSVNLDDIAEDNDNISYKDKCIYFS